MNQPIRIILSNTTHPGNIGAAARAMKNMGLSQLTLVAPKRFPDPVAVHRASGADDVLAQATVVPTLEEAVKDCHWLFGTSARSRTFQWPQIAPKEAAPKIVQLSQEQQVGIVFGNEQAGLSNEELQLCDYHITIPTSAIYSSLNLASAVQVIAYEIFQAVINVSDGKLAEINQPQKAANHEVAGLLAHFEETAIALGFMQPNHRTKLLPKVQKLLAKAQLESEEINILRGFLKAVQNNS